MQVELGRVSSSNVRGGSRMDLDNYTNEATLVASPGNRLYGALSWLFLITCLLVSAAFLISHGVIHSVRTDVLSVDQLESWFFPGVYWTLAASCITLLALSALLLGLTLAIAVVRGCLHGAPCRFYWMVLGVQAVPWVYFFASTY